MPWHAHGRERNPRGTTRGRKRIVIDNTGIQKREIVEEKVGEKLCKRDLAQEGCERYREIKTNTINNQGRISTTVKPINCAKKSKGKFR